MEQLLYWKIGNNSVSASLGGTGFNFPVLKQSDKLRLGFRPSELFGSQQTEVERNVTGVRASIGRLDARPTAGSVAFGIAGQEKTAVPAFATNRFTITAHGYTGDQIVRLSTTDTLPAELSVQRSYFIKVIDPNTVEVALTAGGSTFAFGDDGTGTHKFEQVSSPVSFDADAATVATAFDGLNYVGSGLTYETPTGVDDNGSKLVVFPNAGAEVVIKIWDNLLRPISFARVRANEQNGVWTHEIRYVQAPVALTTAYNTVLPSAPVVSVFQEGATVDENVIPEIQKVVFNPAFRGVYQVRRDGKRTELLDPTDGPEQFAEAIDPLADEDSNFEVSNPAPNIGHVLFAGEMAGVSQDLLEIVVMDAPPGDKWITLDTATWEAAAVLRDAEADANGEVQLYLEVEITYDNPDDAEEDLIWTFETKVRFKKELIWEGLETLPEVDHLRKVDPTSYTPFTEDQISVGHAGVTKTFGASLEEEITHGLNSPYVIIQLRENIPGGEILTPKVDYDTSFDDDNVVTITLKGDFSPAPGANAIAAHFLAMGDTSTFDPHTHTIPQIDLLPEALQALYDRVSVLEAVAGTGGLKDTTATKNAKLSKMITNPVFELYPGRFKAMPERPERLNALYLPGVSLPKRGGLLPAVADPTVTNLSTILVNGKLPTAVGAKGEVYTHDGSTEILVGGGLSRKSIRLQPTEFVTSDNARWYRVTPYARQDATVFTTDFATNDTWFSSTANKLIVGNRVQVTTTGTLPPEVAILTDYFVTVAMPDYVELAAAAGGSSLVLTGNGTGTHSIQLQDETTYYPTDFERKLFEFSVNQDQLIVRSKLEGQWGIELGMIHPVRQARQRATVCQWSFVIEIGTYPQAAGVPQGMNLGDPVWCANPVLERRIVITDTPQIHTFGLEIIRKLVSGVDTVSLNKLLYGNSSGSLAPASANIAIRGRMTRFDLPDGISDPRGFVALLGLSQANTEDGVEAPEPLGFARIV